MLDTGRVFVVQDMGFDYSDAETQFGELVYLLSRKEANVFNTQRVTALLKKRLWDFGFSNKDWLLAVGSPVVMMIAGIEAERLAQGSFRVLQWDREARKYFSITIRRT